MNDVSEHFVLLGMEAAAVAGSGLLTREIGQAVVAGQILAALDAEGQKHLLIPVQDPDVAEDRASRGVLLNRRDLLVDGRTATFADLYCKVPMLGLVFERLLEDVLSRLEQAPTAPVEVCRRALDDWRALLRTAQDGIPLGGVLGLIGELEVLRLLAIRSPAAALDLWRGPSRSLHDFIRGGSELEVKATASVEGDSISVSNIDQLDPTLVSELHLIVVHLMADESAPTLDQRIDQLMDIGFPRIKLLERIRDAGYVYEAPPAFDDRYAVRSVRAWNVDDDFPGLRAGEIREVRRNGLSEIKYSLNLDAAPERLADREFSSLLAEWTRPHT